MIRWSRSEFQLRMALTRLGSVISVWYARQACSPQACEEKWCSPQIEGATGSDDSAGGAVPRASADMSLREGNHLEGGVLADGVGVTVVALAPQIPGRTRQLIVAGVHVVA